MNKLLAGVLLTSVLAVTGCGAVSTADPAKAGSEPSATPSEAPSKAAPKESSTDATGTSEEIGTAPSTISPADAAKKTTTATAPELDFSIPAPDCWTLPVPDVSIHAVSDPDPATAVPTDRMGGAVPCTIISIGTEAKKEADAWAEAVASLRGWSAGDVHDTADTRMLQLYGPDGQSADYTVMKASGGDPSVTFNLYPASTR